MKRIIDIPDDLFFHINSYDSKYLNYAERIIKSSSPLDTTFNKISDELCQIPTPPSFLSPSDAVLFTLDKALSIIRKYY